MFSHASDTTLDQSILAELKALSDDESPEFFWNQVMQFRNRGQALVDAMSAFARRGDLRGLGRVAQALAGSAGLLGAVRLYDLCRCLEDGCLEDHRLEEHRLAPCRMDPPATDRETLLTAIQEAFEDAGATLLEAASNET